jgi:hypothetical protein
MLSLRPKEIARLSVGTKWWFAPASRNLLWFYPGILGSLATLFIEDGSALTCVVMRQQPTSFLDGPNVSWSRRKRGWFSVWISFMLPTIMTESSWLSSALTSRMQGDSGGKVDILGVYIIGYSGKISSHEHVCNCEWLPRSSGLDLPVQKHCERWQRKGNSLLLT